MVGYFEFFWQPKVDCLENIEEKIQNSSMSAEAKQSIQCLVDKKSAWFPRIRHTNSAENLNYLEELIFLSNLNFFKLIFIY